MTDYRTAQAKWAETPHAQRRETLDALTEHNVTDDMHSHDWAALPPQVQNALIAALQPPAEAEAGSYSAPKRRKSED